MPYMLLLSGEEKHREIKQKSQNLRVNFTALRI